MTNGETIKERLVRIETEVHYLKKQIQDIHEITVGNEGKRGLKEEMAELRGGLKTFKFLATIGGGSGLLSAFLLALSKLL